MMMTIIFIMYNNNMRMFYELCIELKYKFDRFFIIRNEIFTRKCIITLVSILYIYVLVELDVKFDDFL
jgi:hypothetical protein